VYISQGEEARIVKPIQFKIPLNGGRILEIPADLAAKLPDSGLATVVVMVEGEADDIAWKTAAYNEFLKDDSEADASYDRFL